MSKAGFATMISYFNADNFFCVTGMMLFANKNARPLTKTAKINNGRINRSKGIPADLIAINSNLSPKLPKVMMEENSNDKGSAVGIQKSVTNPTSFKTVNKSNPLPTKSSMYNQKNCMVNTNMEILKAAIKGPTKALMIRMSSFFITLCF